MKTKLNIVLAMIVLVWTGMIAGISFLEAPVKFTAPSLTLQVGLDVGRHVFSALNKVEIVFCTLMLVLVFAGKLPSVIKFTALLVSSLLALQCFWLLPELDERALMIIAGGHPEGKSPHAWYVIFESVKLVSLALTGYLTIYHLLIQMKTARSII